MTKQPDTPVKRNLHYNARSGSPQFLTVPQFRPSYNYTKPHFLPSTICLWNNLQRELLECGTFNSFKNIYITYLIIISYLFYLLIIIIDILCIIFIHFGCICLSILVYMLCKTCNKKDSASSSSKGGFKLVLLLVLHWSQRKKNATCGCILHFLVVKKG